MVDNKLIKASFMQKLIRQRLEWKYNINDISFEEMGKLYTQWKSIGIEGELTKTIPLSKELYEKVRALFIINMKEAALIPAEATDDDIDMNYIDALTESFLYANKTFLFCTIINPDAGIGKFKELRAVRGPLVKDGYDTLLMLAIVYSNTHNADYIPGIGPVKYRKFQEFFALNFGIDVIEK